MIRTASLAALTLVALTLPAEARRKPATTPAHPDCNVTMPCDLRSATAATPRERARRDRGRRIERAMPFGKATRARAAARNAALAKAAEKRRRAAAARHVVGRVVVARPRAAPTIALEIAPTVGEFVAAVRLLLTPLEGIAAALDHVTRDVVLERTGPAPTIAGYIQKTFQAAGVSLAGVVPALAVKAREIQEACGSRVISAVRRTYIRGTRRISLHASGEAIDMAGNPECMYRLLKDWPGGYSVDYARVKPNHIHISLSAGGRERGARFVHGGGRSARRVRYASAQ